MSRRVMWRTVISGCCGFFLLREARLGGGGSVGSSVSAALRGLRLRAIFHSKPYRRTWTQGAGQKTTSRDARIDERGARRQRGDPYEPTRATSSVTCSTNRALWWRSNSVHVVNVLGSARSTKM